MSIAAPPATTAVYARISEDRQDGAGVTRQLEDCRALAGRRGWEPIAEYLDNDLTASKYARQARPAYTALLAAVREGRIKRIVVWNVDRLYRQSRELEDLIDLAEVGAVEVVSVTSGEFDLVSSDGRLKARILVSVAANESEKNAARVRRAKLQAREQGKPSGGRRPFGWMKDFRTPHEEEAKAILDAADRILAGASLNDIARLWTAAGLHGRRWGVSDISRTLQRPRHAGLIAHNGEVVGHGDWPELMPRETWERLCVAIKGRANNPGTPRRRTLFTGVVHCGLCGEPMTRSVTGSGRGKGAGRRFWRCEPGHRHGGCGKVSISAAPMEQQALDAVFRRVDTMDLAALVTEDETPPEQATIAEQLAGLDRQEDAAADSFSGRRISLRQMERITRDLEAQRTALRTRLARLTKHDALSAYAGRPGALRAAWDRLTEDQQRAIVVEAIGKVTITPSNGRGRRFDPERILLG